MKDLRDILEGQDMSLVWRRDGISGFPITAKDRVAAYRRMASLKTGSLFRLLVTLSSRMNPWIRLSLRLRKEPLLIETRVSELTAIQLVLAAAKRLQECIFFGVCQAEGPCCRGLAQPRDDISYCAGIGCTSGALGHKGPRVSVAS